MSAKKVEGSPGVAAFQGGYVGRRKSMSSLLLLALFCRLCAKSEDEWAEK
jgi:hypothetical protein